MLIILSTMILPKNIKTRHKIRDCKMIQMYQKGSTFDEIGKRFSMTKQGANHIILKNLHIIQIDKNYEQQKRLNRLNRLLDKCSDDLSPKKDVLNVIEQMRKEIEGDKEFIGDKTIVNVYVPGREAITNNSM